MAGYVHPRVALRALTVVACATAALWATPSYALFEDGDARRAILELRERVDALTQSSQQSGERSSTDAAQLRRSLLDMQTQIEALRVEVANLRGANEKLQRDVADLQRSQKDTQQRLHQFEPTTVQVDGMEFVAEPKERQDYEAALGVFRSGKFAEAATAFDGFVRQYPQSGYLPSARFWLGNAQYATRDYKGAIDNFKALLAANPNHARAPEAALSIANCQVELKDTKAARKTLEDLIKVYPQSEAASAAKERLARLK